jgi:hypothetical protein
MLQLVADEALPSFAVGDVPSEPLTFQLDTTTTWTSVEASAGTAAVSGTDVTLTLPPLDTPGILTIVLTLTGEASARATVEPIHVVVEDPMSQWLSLSAARDKWADAPDADVELFELLDGARVACEDFAPAVDVIPNAYRTAQRLQAKAIWGASRATTDNRVGEGQYAVTVYPLDWNVKQLLRPKTGVPVMF